MASPPTRRTSYAKLACIIAAGTLLAVGSQASASAWEPWRPKVAPWVWHEATDLGVALLVVESGCLIQSLPLPYGEEEEQRTAAPGLIEGTIESRGMSQTATINPCSSHRTRLKGTGWRAVLFGEDPSQDGNWPTMELALVAGRNQRRRFRYRVAIGGRRLQAGTITISARFHPAEPVWEGTDAFVNFCIDESQRIESDEGRLYCIGPDYTTTHARVHPDP